MIRHRGFTLVELLVAMVVGALVLLLAASLLGVTGENFTRLGGNIDADREARTVMSQIATDFSAAVYHKDQLFEKGTGTWRKDRAGVLALQSADAQSKAGRNGDLCAVNYYVADVTSQGRVTRCLMRGFRESAETMRGVIAGTVPELFAMKTDVDDLVAFGVVSFEAVPMVRDSTGKWIEWSSSATATTGPEACSVRLVIARKEAIARLKTTSDWDGAGATSARLLGRPAEVSRNKFLCGYQSLIRLGHHANP